MLVSALQMIVGSLRSREVQDVPQEDRYMSDPRYDPHYVNGPCQEFYIHHRWEWNGERWECRRCEKVAHTRRFASIPCVVCGKAVESVFEIMFCDSCRAELVMS